MDSLQYQKVLNVNGILDGNFLDTKHMYFYHFNQFASSLYRSGIDGEKACKAFREKYGGLIVDSHQYKWFDRQKKKFNFDNTIFILSNQVMIEFDDTYCQIFHNNTQEAFIKELIELLNRFKDKQRRAPLEMNIIVQGKNGLYLKAME